MELILSKKILVIVLVCSITACAKIYHKSKFFLAKSKFEFKRITFKTDGYYYAEKVYEKGENRALEKANEGARTCAISPIIFYTDGYVRKVDAIYGVKPFATEEAKKDSIRKSLIELERLFVDNSFHVPIENTIWDWGMYRQTGNEVLIQYYSNHFGDYRLINVYGSVKNDSTILLTRKFGYKQPNLPYVIDEELNEIYRFKKFHIKPDSMNYIRTNIHEFRGKEKE